MSYKNRMRLMAQQKQRKKTFKVGPDDTLAEVLERMKEEGYQVTRRMEVPVFKEEGGEVVVSHQETVFEGKLIK